MDSEDIYRYKSRPALEALKLQAEEHLAEFVPLEGDQPVWQARCSAVGPGKIEYKSKGPVRELKLMFEADEDEI